MICPFCSADDDRVIDSRSAEGGAVIRRRRECVACGRRFTTYERVEKTRRLVVIKKDGSRVPFDGEKVLSGLHAACGKRPIAETDKTQLVEAIEDELHREFDREVESTVIGQRVAARLRDLDQIAYIRYASEYYDFRTVDDFVEELTDLRARERSRATPNQQNLFDGES